MKRLLLILILSVSFPMMAIAKSELECYKDMAKATKMTEEKITVMMMQCNNLFLKGQFRYLRANVVKNVPDSQRSTASIDDVDLMSATQKATYIYMYTKCEENAKLVTQWIKQCTKSR